MIKNQSEHPTLPVKYRIKQSDIGYHQLRNLFNDLCTEYQILLVRYDTLGTNAASLEKTLHSYIESSEMYRAAYEKCHQANQTLASAKYFAEQELSPVDDKVEQE